jgi:hypothetical protein
MVAPSGALFVSSITSASSNPSPFTITPSGIHMSTSRVCNEPRCGRPLHGWGAFCGIHSNRNYRYGHPGIKEGLRESDLKPFAEWTAEGLTKYRASRATEAALKLAQEVLDYRATHGRTYQLQLEHMMQILKDDQVNAEDVLRRVALFVAFATAHPERFKGSTRVEDLALARCVMRLAPLQKTGKRYPSRSLALLGGLLRDALYRWGLNLVDRLKRDAEAHHEKVTASLDLDTPADVPVSEPRAGIAYRKRRGVQGAC